MRFATTKKKAMIIIVIAAAILVLAVIAIASHLMSRHGDGRFHPAPEKPVIYLYPVEPAEITVHLDYNGILGFTYPAYDNGWHVTAYPDGTLINQSDGREYSYLFWEGCGEADYDLSKGFVVGGEDTVEFLQDKLSFMGLLPKEYNEFIVYWAPRMQNNDYNFITFQSGAYTDTAALVISPAPDSVLRIHMTFTPLDEPFEIEEQVLSPFARTGFTVVEWGGSEIHLHDSNGMEYGALFRL